ncbi:unnamed protein product [Rotaria sp. Silwood2]|nr:unnamed protein product [Rotaria sp. Silwood2]CAF3108602.1 unnamed protein product [Rotaria sp. Silwood2]CAF4112549.1 unnamed protein product [Rotaria sp. Silwood2]CAF4618092.1 unnamed protein product [Rotaria sp. Silwood2]
MSSNSETQFSNSSENRRRWEHVSFIYGEVKNSTGQKTISDTIEEAVHEIVKGGIVLDKEHEARWLAAGLPSVKHYANSSTP